MGLETWKVFVAYPDGPGDIIIVLNTLLPVMLKKLTVYGPAPPDTIALRVSHWVESMSVLDTVSTADGVLTVTRSFADCADT